MVQAIEKPAINPAYLEFFGLTRPPFARLSRQSEFFHTEQYSLLMTHLVSAAEHADSLVVICGADGSGKTTLLSSFVANLGDDIHIANIDETCDSEMQFYTTFLKQLGFGEISGTPRELQNITREFLVHRAMAGDPVLMIIDNAHHVSPTVLEQLRRISSFKVKNQRVLSVILAGNSDLERIMESTAMSQVKFRSHVLFHIRNYTEKETANYVWHHLRMVGGTDGVKFSNEAHPLIHRYTGGIPKLINMLCNDVLEQAHELKTRVISENLVRSVADDRRLLPHVVPQHGKGRRSSDPDFEPDQPIEPAEPAETIEPEQKADDQVPANDAGIIDSAEEYSSKAVTPDGDSKSQLELISRLAEQVGDLRADKKRALQDIGTRDKDLNDLRDKLELQTTEIEKLAGALGSNTDEIGRQNKALSDSREALQESEKTAKRLAIDLEKERHAAIGAQTDIVKTIASEEMLDKLKIELRAANSERQADLEQENERTATIDALEKSAAALKDELEKRAKEALKLRDTLDSRDESLGTLKEQLQESQIESKSAMLLVDSLKNLAGPVSVETAEEVVEEAVEEVAEKDLPDAEEEAEVLPPCKVDLVSFKTVAEFKRSIESVLVYQTLKDFEPTAYNRAITTVEQMIRQNYREQQIKDALRVQQAELIEQRLPRASDEAIVSYIRLIEHQLSEFQLNGADLCFRMMIPKTAGDDLDVSPVISEKTREREYSILAMTLKSYDANRTIPAEGDVWAYLGPIFGKLFEKYGEDNVSALYDPEEPEIDDAMTCFISKTLYSEILKLSEDEAANVMRWMLSN